MNQSYVPTQSSIEYIEKPFEGPASLAYDHSKDKFDVVPFYEISEANDLPSCRDDVRSEFKLLTLENLKEASADLGVTVHRDLLELAVGHEKASALNQIQILAWGKREIQAKTYKITHKNGIPDVDLHGTHYLVGTKQQAAYMLIATIEFSDLATVSSIKVSGTDPLSGVGVLGKLANTQRKKVGSVTIRYNSHHISGPDTKNTKVVANLAESNLTVDGLLDYIKKLNEMLENTTNDGISAGIYKRYNFLELRGWNNKLMKSAGDLQDYCEKALNLLDKYLAFYKNSNNEKVIVLEEFRNAVAAVVQEIRRFDTTVSPRETLLAAQNQLEDLSDNIVKACKELDLLIATGRVYNIKKDGKLVAWNGNSLTGNGLLALGDDNPASVRLYKLRCKAGKIVGKNEADPIISPKYPVWIELSGTDFGGFMRQIPWYHNFGKGLLARKHRRVDVKSYRFEELAYDKDSHSILAKAFSMGHNANRFKFVIEYVNESVSDGDSICGTDSFQRYIDPLSYNSCLDPKKHEKMDMKDSGNGATDDNTIKLKIKTSKYAGSTPRYLTTDSSNRVILSKVYDGSSMIFQLSDHDPLTVALNHYGAQIRGLGKLDLTEKEEEDYDFVSDFDFCSDSVSKSESGSNSNSGSYAGSDSDPDSYYYSDTDSYYYSELSDGTQEAEPDGVFDNNVNILQGKLPEDSDYSVFHEHKVRADGNCGFYVLGVTRNDFVNVLLGLAENKEAREKLIPEIQEAITSEFLDEPSKEGGTLFQYLTWLDVQAQDALNEARLSYPKMDQAASISESIAWLQENKYFEAANKLELSDLEAHNARTTFEQYCQRMDVFNAYVKCFRAEEGNLWLGYHSALLYAQAKGIKLFIWNRYESDPAKINLSYSSPDTGLNGQCIHALHINGSHFNLLELQTVPSADKTPTSKTSDKADVNAKPSLETHHRNASSLRVCLGPIVSIAPKSSSPSSLCVCSGPSVSIAPKSSSPSSRDATLPRPKAKPVKFVANARVNSATAFYTNNKALRKPRYTAETYVRVLP